LFSQTKVTSSFPSSNISQFDLSIVSYFQHSKFTSFQRQLNLYGFCRIRSGQDKGGYYHANFVMGRSELTYDIKYALKQDSLHVTKENPSFFHEIRGMIDPSKIDEIDSSPSSDFNDQANMQRYVTTAPNLYIRDIGAVKDPLLVRSELDILYHASRHTSEPPFLELPKSNPLPFYPHPIFSSHNLPMISPPNDHRTCCPIQIDIGTSDANSRLSQQGYLISLIIAELLKVESVLDTSIELKKS
jgi:HSF-type DNA-binding